MRKHLVVVAALISTGCIPTLKENPGRDVSKAVPNSFRRDQKPENDQEKDNSGQKTWKEFFSSPELQSLIEQALKNNQELNYQLQEIIISQNEVAARRGEYLPKMGAFLGAGGEKVGEFTPQGQADRVSGVPPFIGNFNFGLSGSWEVDIWGKLRNAANAAQMRYLASGEARNFMITQLVAEIARSYYELLALDNQLEVLRRNIAIQTDALEVVKLEKQGAKVTQLAVYRFEAEVLKNRSRLFNLEQSRIVVENRINFLVGRFPQPVARAPDQLMTPLPTILGSGTPTELLSNRPDLRRAELELEGAKLDVKSTRARFFPSLSIDANLGYQTFNITHLVDTPASLLANFAGNILAPLLNRAGIEADYRSANARQIQAIINYERTLLQAFTDVANQQAKYENLQKAFDLQSQQVDVLKQSVEVSNVLFQSARADYMEVLLTRRDSLDAQMELIETRLDLLESMVNMYQALGGGWQYVPSQKN